MRRVRAAVDEARAARPLDIAPWLFCTDEGECYLDSETGRAGSFESAWQRSMDRVLKETKVTQRFAERDLRAKGRFRPGDHRGSSADAGSCGFPDHPQALSPPPANRSACQATGLNSKNPFE